MLQKAEKTAVKFFEGYCLLEFALYAAKLQRLALSCWFRLIFSALFPTVV
jgi:hypothetical protein